ncbi:MAG: hypothetical protein IJH55_00655 [Romboutsia sp.]|nr:hypothetical protein [Romboutsia sp.]
MPMNAKQQLQSACTQLGVAQNALNQAMSTVEKEDNRKELQKALNAVNNAVSVANNANQNYRD